MLRYAFVFIAIRQSIKKRQIILLVVNWKFPSKWPNLEGRTKLCSMSMISFIKRKSLDVQTACRVRHPKCRWHRQCYSVNGFTISLITVLVTFLYNAVTYVRTIRRLVTAVDVTFLQAAYYHLYHSRLPSICPRSWVDRAMFKIIGRSLVRVLLRCKNLFFASSVSHFLL